MALNKKESRPIAVDGHDFRWSFFENSGWNDLLVQSENGAGRKLVAQFGWQTQDASKLPYQSITPALVAEAIRFGQENGWDPDENGVPFECKYKNATFSLESPDRSCKS